MLDLTAARLTMVESQVRANRVTDERVIEAMRSTPRELFLPMALQAVTYADEDLPLGGQRYAVEPMVLARLIQSLELVGTERIMVIAANGGYSAALAAKLGDSVVAVEPEERLMKIARDGWQSLRLANVTPVVGPAAEGHKAGAPYDAILVEGAVEDLPAGLTAQLADGGRLACMFRGSDGVSRALLVTERAGALGRRFLFDAGTPTLPGFARPRAFAL